MASRAPQWALSLGCPLSSSTSASLEGGLPVCGGGFEGYPVRPDP